MSSRTNEDLRIPWDRSSEVVPVAPSGSPFGQGTVVAVPRAPADISPTAFWLLLLLLVGALLLRLPGIGSGLWADEIDTLLHFVTLPFHDIPFALESQNNHVLFTMLAKLSRVIFGYSAWAFRLPAVIMGVAGVYAVYRLGREIAGEREGILAAALIAASSQHVFFSQNGRGYTGMFLFATLSVALLLRLLDRTRHVEPDQASPVSVGVTTTGYVLTLFFGVLCHLTAGAIIAVHFLIGLWVVARKTHRPVILGATVCAGLLVALVILPSLGTVMGGLAGDEVEVSQAVEWSSVGWFVAETLRGLGNSVPGGWPVLLAAGALGGLGVLSVAWRRPAAVVAMLAPGLIIFVALVATDHNLWPRFFFFAGGYAVIFGVRGVMQVLQAAPGSSWRTKVPGGPVKVGTFALWLAVLASLAMVPRVWGPKQDFEGAVTWLAENDSESRVVGVVPFAHEALLDYYDVPGTTIESLGELEELEATGSPVHVVYAFPTYIQAATPGLWNRLQDEYAVVHVLPGTIQEGEVVILERNRNQR